MLAHEEIKRLAHAIASELRPHNGNRIGLLADVLSETKPAGAGAESGSAWFAKLRAHHVIGEIAGASPTSVVALVQLCEFIVTISPGAGREAAIDLAIHVLLVESGRMKPS